MRDIDSAWSQHQQKEGANQSLLPRHASTSVIPTAVTEPADDSRFARLVKLLPLPLCCVNQSGVIIYSNDRFVQTFGYTLQDIPTLEEWWRQAYPDEAYRQRVIQTWRAAVEDAALSNTDIEPEEYRVTCKDGRVRVMLISGITFEDSLLATFVDVTERKHAEEALQHERALLNTIMSATDVMLVYLDRDFNFVTVNPAYAATCRRHAEELLGQNHFALYPNAENEAIFRHVRDTGSPVFHKDKPFEFPDQPERGVTYWDWSLVPVKNADGQVVGLVFSLRETTKHKRTELSLRETESRYRALFERMEQGVVYQDAEGRITDANPAAVRLLGLTLDQLRGLTSLDRCWQAVHEDGTPFPGSEHPAMVALRTGHPVSDVVMGVRSGEGSTCRWILVDAVPEFRADGTTPRQVFTTFTDITHRRQVEEQRLQLERQMQETRRLESLGVLAGGIAHDFNNLLTAILGHTELLLGDQPPASTARADLDAIKHACSRAAELCRQMLAYSGQGRYVTETLQLSRVADAVVQLLRHSLPPGIQLEREWAEEMPAFRGDANQIRQVIQSLIQNSAEAIGDRAGVVRMSAGAMHCSPQSLNKDWRYDSLVEGTYAWLEVSDTGCGMDAGTLARVFEPFFTTKFTGRGLGLPAVLGIVKGHQGAIRIQSKRGKGTTVRVLFPAISTASPAKQPKEA